ncbi:MAG: ABC transporter ATP-binding protein [Cloacibacterium sp.]|jgi:ABC-2 type transport system ATP-binding protein|nr:ABC transporter ATP-binding protein [Cloacibacterium sp.]
MLIAKQLNKKYNGNHHALKDLDLTINEGEIFCLLGANGAGKSTTVNIFMGFLEPSSGEAFINGSLVTVNNNTTRELVAYIPENVKLYPELSGIENLDFFASLSNKTYSQQELKQFLLKAGLQEEAHQQKVGGYSKGMRQKVGIALAIAKQAKALFLDEPTSGLDPHAANEFSEILKELAKEQVAILMVTHDIFRAKEVADRIGIMKNGVLEQVIPASEISHTELENRYLDIIKNN